MNKTDVNTFEQVRAVIQFTYLELQKNAWISIFSFIYSLLIHNTNTIDD